MQARIGEPNRYLLSVKQAGASTLDVTLSDASGDYSCNFTNVLAEHRWHRDRLAAVEVLRA